MCGRITQHRRSDDYVRAIGEPFSSRNTIWPQLAPTWNRSPGRCVQLARLAGEDKRPTLESWWWGLIPSWAKEPRKGMICNVRAETVASKFGQQLRKQRCLIPVDGFYEWRLEDGQKQPYYIRRADDQPMIMAGLWDRWRYPEAGREPEPSCTIVTTEPNRLMKAIHDRMPVILEPENYQRWLDTDVTDPAAVLPLLKPYAPEELIAYKVSREVNNTRNDARELIQPLA